VDAAATIRTAREHAGLSKRELARRARTSPAAIVAYEGGGRDPSVGTLERILAATGHRGEIVVSRRAPRPDRRRAARLRQVLELAEHLPRRRASRHLRYPPLP
jgi:transcriptional regulator with XRE-family HTH domain